MSDHSNEQLGFKPLLLFFLPLGFSASLVTLSHVIINSTLARSERPEIVIASYAIPLSLLAITEKPAVLLRQTCSALVRDRLSYRAMFAVSTYVLLCVVLVGLLISYTPVGEWVFLYFFGVQPQLVEPVVHVYRILMFVSIFSGLRCMYHGIIISNMRTKWLTIGMLIRLAVMYALSVYFIATKQVTSGRVGAIIFLVGMMIECLMAWLEARSLLNKTVPEKKDGHEIVSKSQVFRFYRPLLVSSILAVFIGPSINAMLGKTSNLQLAIASFAIAGSLTQLVQSFFSYMHQLVLNFYRKDAAAVNRFALMIGFIPALLLALLGYTSAGPWFMEHVMGVNAGLLHASLDTLRVFILLTLLFPWLDFCNGILMLRGQTKVMVWSQAANVLMTAVTLVVCVFGVPSWNGRIGALAQSLGVAAELAVDAYVILTTAKSTERPLHARPDIRA